MIRQATGNGLEYGHVEHMPAQRLRKVLIVTDTWGETNGLTTTLRHTLAAGEQQGYTFDILHPGAFRRFPNPLYL